MSNATRSVYTVTLEMKTDTEWGANRGDTFDVPYFGVYPNDAAKRATERSAEIMGLSALAFAVVNVRREPNATVAY